MKITLVSGSHRENSQSSKVTRYMSNRLTGLDDSTSTHIVDLKGNPLPLWDESVWSDGPQWQESWQPIAKELQSSDGFVFVVPEWAGMAPSGFKNFMLLCGNQELGHKPILLVGVSASRNGAYPISELRMNSTKNNHGLIIPDHLIVRGVEGILNGDEAKDEEETYIRKRIDYSLTMLSEYAKALKPLRSSSHVDFKAYPNGM